MTTIGQIERETQNRIVALFRDQLNYTYLGNWEDRPDNSNIEEELLTKYLSGKGYGEGHINIALQALAVVAKNYDNNLYTMEGLAGSPESISAWTC